jgi:hypothetical protein
MPGQTGPVLRETFAPILYVMRELGDAIRSHNLATAASLLLAAKGAADLGSRRPNVLNCPGLKLPYLPKGLKNRLE